MNMKITEIFSNDGFVSQKQNLANTSPVTTPSELQRQTFLMNFPLTLNTQDPNNDWMKKLSSQDRKINYEVAFEEFYSIYSFMISQGAIVYLLPNEGNFQDQVYVGNLGIYLPHIIDKNVIVVSNYTSKPRRGEELVGKKLFEQMKYTVYKSPNKWEGEADLKYLRDNIYIGGYGIRTEKTAYDWMSKKFDMTVVPVHNASNPLLYHFDTLFLRLTKDKVLMPTAIIDKADIKQIEKYVEIIDIHEDVAATGCFNSVSVGKYLMCPDPNHLIYKQKKDVVPRVDKYMKIVEKHSGLIPKYFKTTEFQRSGADIGCLIFHLNYRGF